MRTTDAAAIVAEGLRRSYGEREALAGVDFEVRAGEVFAFLGPNGGGKTTLFRVLSTLIPPSGGSARVFGRSLVAEAAEVRRRIGVVFQHPSLDKKLTAMENLRCQGRLYGLRGAALGARAEEVLARVGLADRAGERVERLSGGQRRRVEVAKGLLHRPELLLLDEPSTGLDPGARLEMWAYLDELRVRDGVTVVLTTHLMDEAERCDRLAILHGGRLVALGAPDALKDEVGGEVVTIACRAPAELADAIRSAYGVEARVVGRTLRLERAGALEFARALTERFGKEVQSVTVGKPTLEDVFIQRTGADFWQADAAAEPETPPRGGRR